MNTVAVRVLLLAMLATAGCKERRDRKESAPALPTTSSPFEAAPWLADARCVEAYRDGDEVHIVAGGKQWLKHFDGDGNERSSSLRDGVCQRLSVVKLGDRQLLISAFGAGVGAVSAPASVVVVDTAVGGDGDALALPKTARQQVVGVAGGDQEHLWVASFVSKYRVALTTFAWLDGGWAPEAQGTVRMAWDIASGDVDGDGDVELVVARPYGETLESDGDVFVVSGDERTVLPSTRGARAVVWSESDKALVVADGWHKEYGKKAQALLTRIEATSSGGFKATELALAPGRAGFSSLALGDVDGDGKLDVVAAGDGPAIVVPVAGGEVTEIGSGPAADAAVIDLDGDGVDEVVVVGPMPGIWKRPKSSK